MPSEWPTHDSVLAMAEPLPETGDVTNLVMTPLGLHWLGDGGRSLHRLAPGSTTPTLVAMGDVTSSELVANATAVVWYWDPSVWSLALDASASPVELATDIDLTGSELLLDDANVYHVPGFEGPFLNRIPLAGGAPERAETDALEVIAVHDGYVYYREPDITGGTTKRVALGGGAPEDVTMSGDLAQLVFDGNVLYYSTDSGIDRTELGDPASMARMLTLPTGPDGPSDANHVNRMVLDGDRLVYADRFGTIGWVTTDGAECGNILVDPIKAWAPSASRSTSRSTTGTCTCSSTPGAPRPASSTAWPDRASGSERRRARDARARPTCRRRRLKLHSCPEPRRRRGSFGAT